MFVEDYFRLFLFSTNWSFMFQSNSVYVDRCRYSRAHTGLSYSPISLLEDADFTPLHAYRITS
jgi:hypothetical protein